MPGARSDCPLPLARPATGSPRRREHWRRAKPCHCSRHCRCGGCERESDLTPCRVRGQIPPMRPDATVVPSRLGSRAGCEGRCPSGGRQRGATVPQHGGSVRRRIGKMRAVAVAADVPAAWHAPCRHRTDAEGRRRLPILRNLRAVACRGTPGGRPHSRAAGRGPPCRFASRTLRRPAAAPRRSARLPLPCPQPAAFRPARPAGRRSRSRRAPAQGLPATAYSSLQPRAA